MKAKISILCLPALLVFFSSCKKESSVSIVGQWRSVSNYTMLDNGTYQWTPASWPQVYNFSSQGRFDFHIDAQGSGGSYNYDEVSQKLTLYYADPYGNAEGTASLKVEVIDRDKLILSGSPSGIKTQYSRIN